MNERLGIEIGNFFTKSRYKESCADGQNIIYKCQFSLYFSIYVNTGCGLNLSDQDSPEESPIAGNNFAAVRESTGNAQVTEKYR